jgi:hypothetical protein
LLLFLFLLCLPVGFKVGEDLLQLQEGFRSTFFPGELLEVPLLDGLHELLEFGVRKVKVAWLTRKQHLLEERQQASVPLRIKTVLVAEGELHLVVEVLADIVRTQREITEEVSEAKHDSDAVLLTALESEVLGTAGDAFKAGEHVGRGVGVAVGALLLEAAHAGREES